MIIIQNDSLKIYRNILILLFVFVTTVSFYDLKYPSSVHSYNLRAVLLFFQVLLFIIFMLYIITSQKISNREKQEFDSLTKIVPGGIAKVYGNDKFTIHYADDTFYKMIGYSKEEFFNDFNNNSKFLIHPDDLNSVIRTFKFQLDNGQSFKASFRVIKKNSEIIWVYARGNTLSINKNISLYNFIFTDITTPQNTLSKLELENKRYDIICKLSDKVYFEYDILNNTLINSTVCRKLFGNDHIIANFKENLINSDVIYKDDIPDFLILCDDFSNGKENISYNLRIKNDDNSYTKWHIRGEPIFDKTKTPIKIIGKAASISND
ncbi:PAS domain-containing protein [uncultured Clostridium sp.]|uniref:PAS domain-containing protein n=1 Tax=uncultured Clostridium sp. TaxID=59620 RepID=UPI0025D9012A|nr:PAS domain-containing protein [uncultured Clostridium sp.]